MRVEMGRRLELLIGALGGMRGNWRRCVEAVDWWEEGHGDDGEGEELGEPVGGLCGGTEGCRRRRVTAAMLTWCMAGCPATGA